MDLFISFLTVPVEQTKNHMGYDTGWTQRIGDNGLIISGGIVNGIDYLDALQYGKNLDNPYNNYINPFYLFGIFTRAWRCFFMNYYKEEIDKLLKEKDENIEHLKSKLEYSIEYRDNAYRYFDTIVDNYKN